MQMRDRIPRFKLMEDSTFSSPYLQASWEKQRAVGIPSPLTSG